MNKQQFIPQVSWALCVQRCLPPMLYKESQWPAGVVTFSRSFLKRRNTAERPFAISRVKKKKKKKKKTGF